MILKDPEEQGKEKNIFTIIAVFCSTVEAVKKSIRRRAKENNRNKTRPHNLLTCHVDETVVDGVCLHTWRTYGVSNHSSPTIPFRRRGSYFVVNFLTSVPSFAVLGWRRILRRHNPKSLGTNIQAPLKVLSCPLAEENSKGSLISRIF